MSTLLDLPAARQSASSIRKIAWPGWLREPLLHFLVLGGLLFFVDDLVTGRIEDPRTIVIGAAVDNQARQVFKASRGREPNEDELYALRRVWLDNEVLYREGIAMQVDRGDTAIRERIIFKALSVVNANIRPPALDENALRAWFQNNRAKYDEPARYDFDEAVLAGAISEATVRAFVDTLNKGAPGETNAGLRVFKGRPRANVVQSYGEDFARALEAAAPGAWRAYATRDGWRAMRLESATPFKPAVFEEQRGAILQDWIDAGMAEQRTAAVRALAQKYRIKVEGGTR